MNVCDARLIRVRAMEMYRYEQMRAYMCFRSANIPKMQRRCHFQVFDMFSFFQKFDEALERNKFRAISEVCISTAKRKKVRPEITNRKLGTEVSYNCRMA